MSTARLEEAQAGVKIAGRNINNLSYADDITLMAESEEELKSLRFQSNSETQRKFSSWIISMTHFLLHFKAPLLWVGFYMLSSLKQSSLSHQLSCQNKNEIWKHLWSWISVGLTHIYTHRHTQITMNQNRCMQSHLYVTSKRVKCVEAKSRTLVMQVGWGRVRCW